MKRLLAAGLVAVMMGCSSPVVVPVSTPTPMATQTPVVIEKIVERIVEKEVYVNLVGLRIFSLSDVSYIRLDFDTDDNFVADYFEIRRIFRDGDDYILSPRPVETRYDSNEDGIIDDLEVLN